MTPVPMPSDRAEAPLFSDGLGDRVVTSDGATGDLLQILRLRPALTAVPSFEFALRERTARLANFRHAYYSRVRRIDRAMSPTPSLAVVSDHVEGIRLSEILRVAQARHLQLDINAALCLIRQLVPAVALLHENARDVAHGTIALERLVVTPHARLVIVEHILGSAVEQLRWSRERLWREFRVAMPPTAGAPRFDHRADVVGVGMAALSLILGRPIGEDEFPQRVADLLEHARERSSLGDEQPLSTALRSWLARALQLDVRRAFATGPEALAALDEVVGDDSVYVAAPVALETFLSRYIASLVEPLEPETPATSSQEPPDWSSFRIPSAHEVAAQQQIVRDDHPAQDDHDDFEAEEDLTPALSDLVDVSDLRVEPAVAPPRAPVVAPAPPPVAAPEPVVAAASVFAPEPVVAPPPVMVPDPAKPLFNPDAPFSMPAAAPEQPLPMSEPAGTTKGSPRRKLMAIAAVVLLLAAGGAAYVGYAFYGIGRGAPAMGTLVVQSNPAGVKVFVDGVDRGVTPARLTVAPGSHILELRGSGVPRVIPLTVSAGAELSQYLEFAETPITGQLAVQSDPPGAKVTVDGVERGIAPITVQDLAAGEHDVVLRADSGSVRHKVVVQGGAIASLLAPMGAAAPAGPVSGWVSVRAPFTVEIYEQGRLLGTTDAERVMLASGKHELEFVNGNLGLRVSRTVQVTPGKVTPVPLELPRGVVNLNATPWAEVWIDGQRAGETPLGNVSLTIGPHEVVFRHPQLGEKRHAIAVTAGAPVRLSVDMK